jgi:hypothetical protein
MEEDDDENADNAEDADNAQNDGNDAGFPVRWMPPVKPGRNRSNAWLEASARCSADRTNAMAFGSSW